MEKPKLVLSGEDGNAFMIIGLAQRVAKAAGWPKEKWAEVRTAMMKSANYEMLLATAMEHFDVE